jgi:uncharacterized OsmC-like protein
MRASDLQRRWEISRGHPVVSTKPPEARMAVLLHGIREEAVVVELIWDARRTATANAPGGTTITVGSGGGLSPEDLLAAAAAGCLMRTFLDLADETGVPVLSYGSASEVDASGDPSRVLVRSYVVTTDDVPEQTIRRLLRESVNASPLCRMLGGRLQCQPDVRCLRGTRAS